MIKEMGGIRVGLLGLVSNRFSGSLAPQDKETFRLAEPMEAARQVIDELKKKNCKVIIVIAHMEENEQRKLAETFREVYFVVSGHTRDLKRQRVEVNNAQILTAGTRGEYLGQMDFFLKEKPDETRLLSHYQIISLGDFYGDHPKTAKLVNQFRADSKPLYLAESKSPPPEKDPRMQNRSYAYPISNYMGDQSCLSCHQPQHENWKKNRPCQGLSNPGSRTKGTQTIPAFPATRRGSGRSPASRMCWRTSSVSPAMGRGGDIPRTGKSFLP